MDHYYDIKFLLFLKSELWYCNFGRLCETLVIVSLLWCYKHIPHLHIFVANIWSYSIITLRWLTSNIHIVIVAMLPWVTTAITVFGFFSFELTWEEQNVLLHIQLSFHTHNEYLILHVYIRIYLKVLIRKLKKHLVFGRWISNLC